MSGSMRGTPLPSQIQHVRPGAAIPVRKLQLSISAVAGLRRPAAELAEKAITAHDSKGATQMLERSFEATEMQQLVDVVASPIPQQKQSAGKREIILVIEGETLHSTPGQTAIVTSGLLMTGALFAQGVCHVHDAPSAAAAVAAFSSAYLFAGAKDLQLVC